MLDDNFLNVVVISLTPSGGGQTASAHEEHAA